MKIDLSNKETGLKSLYQNTLNYYSEYLKSKKMTSEVQKRIMKEEILPALCCGLFIGAIIGFFTGINLIFFDSNKFILAPAIGVIAWVITGSLAFVLNSVSAIAKYNEEYKKAEEEFYNISKNIDAFLNAALNGEITLQYKMTSRNAWAYRELLKCKKLSENRIIKVMFRSTGLCNTKDLIITYADPNGDVKKETINDVFYSENIDVEDDLLYLNENGNLCFVKKVAANQTA